MLMWLPVEPSTRLDYVLRLAPEPDDPDLIVGRCGRWPPVGVIAHRIQDAGKQNERDAERADDC
jgi:hypothetical protein